MKLLPFNLEQARAGAAVITRIGQTPQTIYYPSKAAPGSTIFVRHQHGAGRMHEASGGKMLSVEVENGGGNWATVPDCALDLFMAPIEKTILVDIIIRRGSVREDVRIMPHLMPISNDWEYIAKGVRLAYTEGQGL